MPLYPIDLLNIRDNDSRKQHYEKLVKNADEHKNYYCNYIWHLQKKSIWRLEMVFI
jgi:hypothetical protein